MWCVLELVSNKLKCLVLKASSPPRGKFRIMPLIPQIHAVAWEDLQYSAGAMDFHKASQAGTNVSITSSTQVSNMERAICSHCGLTSSKRSSSNLHLVPLCTPYYTLNYFTPFLIFIFIIFHVSHCNENSMKTEAFYCLPLYLERILHSKHYMYVHLTLASFTCSGPSIQCIQRQDFKELVCK